MTHIHTCQDYIGNGQTVKIHRHVTTLFSRFLIISNTTHHQSTPCQTINNIFPHGTAHPSGQFKQKTSKTMQPAKRNEQSGMHSHWIFTDAHTTTEPEIARVGQTTN